MGITIGRDNCNDLRIPQTYETVSNRHADIEEINGKLYIIDHSRNGTIVNGHRITNSRMEIAYGDKIQLSTSYTLQWSDIVSFFPHHPFPTVLDNDHSVVNEISGRMTTRNTPVHYYANNNPEEERNTRERMDRYDVERAKKGWNWGAFLLGWIWGVGHRCWWPLLASLGIGFLTGLLTVISPEVSIVLCSVSNILCIIMAVYLGMNGNAIGWDNGCYDNIEHFHTKERKWTIAGLIVWGVYILMIVLLVLFIISSLT